MEHLTIMSNDGWRVHKFGGTSLASADCFRRVADILLDEQAERQAVVVSAMGGMTDALLGLVTAAEQSADGIAAGLEAIEARYRSTVESLIEQPAARATLLEGFTAELRDASDVLHAIALVRSAADRSRDLVAGYGELWAARLLATYLEQLVGEAGLSTPVRWLDARRLIVVEHGEMGPGVVWDLSRSNAEAHFDQHTVG
ncbi:MAG: hypothetical protein OEU92_31175, partial [Alphaproteobacteria bacterium]|nr:hypothetical protein [Alphaproteobacteria bacterium]